MSLNTQGCYFWRQQFKTALRIWLALASDKQSWCARIWAVVGYSMILLPNIANAGEARELPVTSLGAFLQALLALFVVLAAFLAILWFMRRLSSMQGGTHGLVRVVGGVMLGTRERLVIVEVADQWLLLGVAAGQVNHLHTMPKPQGYSAPADRPATDNFASKLAELLGRRAHR